MISVNDLSPDQRTVFDAMTAFPRSGDDLLKVGGFAGSGKSTVTGIFARNAQKAGFLIAYVTFTGRASSVLARSLKNAGVEFTTKTRKPDEDEGLSAAAVASYFDMDLSDRDSGPAFCGTIHRLIYQPHINEKDELCGWAKRSMLDRDYDLIVVDEASMVSDEMLEDLQGFGLPILAVGDHGQLPPVRAKGSLMAAPDVRLEKIHRQAEGNPIIALSRHVREGGRLYGFKTSDARVAIRQRRDVASIHKAAYADVSPMQVGVLCWTNKQRIQINGMARQALGFKGAPRKGEVIICLRNMRDNGVRPAIFNGMRGLMDDDAETGPKPWNITVDLGFPEEDIEPHRYILCAPQFNRERVFEKLDELHERGIRVDKVWDAGCFMDFGYCLTTHKSQGSSFEHGIVYCDRPWDGSDDARKFYYTAVTRASQRLTVLL